MCAVAEMCCVPMELPSNVQCVHILVTKYTLAIGRPISDALNVCSASDLALHVLCFIKCVLCAHIGKTTRNALAGPSVTLSMCALAEMCCVPLNVQCVHILVKQYTLAIGIDALNVCSHVLWLRCAVFQWNFHQMCDVCTLV